MFSPVGYVIDSVRHALSGAVDTLASERAVSTIDEFRALPDRERAARTIKWLKRLGRFTVGMAPREMEDHEIIAAILIGNGEITK